jgi:hypothetical protein
MPALRLLLLAFLSTWTSGQISEVFRDPEKACARLDPEGFSSGELTFHPHGFECSAAVDRKDIRSGATHAFAKGTITYTVSGENIYRVSRIKLVVELTPQEDGHEVMSHFARLSHVILTRLEIDVPKELPDVMKSTRYRRWLQNTGTISFDPGRAPHTLRVLTVRHPGIRVVPIPRAATAPSLN